MKELERMSAERLLKEIELRREAGQYRLVMTTARTVSDRRRAGRNAPQGP